MIELKDQNKFQLLKKKILDGIFKFLVIYYIFSLSSLSAFINNITIREFNEDYSFINEETNYMLERKFLNWSHFLKKNCQLDFCLLSKVMFNILENWDFLQHFTILKLKKKNYPKHNLHDCLSFQALPGAKTPCLCIWKIRKNTFQAPKWCLPASRRRASEQTLLPTWSRPPNDDDNHSVLISPAYLS